MRRAYGNGKNEERSKKTELLIVRCTQEEKKNIVKRAKKYKMKLSQYCRCQLAEEPVIVVNFAKTAQLLANMASNLNQIAKHLNTTREVKDIENIRNTISEIGKVLPTLINSVTKKEE